MRRFVNSFFRGHDWYRNGCFLVFCFRSSFLPYVVMPFYDYSAMIERLFLCDLLSVVSHFVIFCHYFCYFLLAKISGYLCYIIPLTRSIVALIFLGQRKAANARIIKCVELPI